MGGAEPRRWSAAEHGPVHSPSGRAFGGVLLRLASHRRLGQVFLQWTCCHELNARSLHTLSGRPVVQNVSFDVFFFSFVSFVERTIYQIFTEHLMCADIEQEMDRWITICCLFGSPAQQSRQNPRKCWTMVSAAAGCHASICIRAGMARGLAASTEEAACALALSFHLRHSHAWGTTLSHSRPWHSDHYPSSTQPIT